MTSGVSGSSGSSGSYGITDTNYNYAVTPGGTKDTLGKAKSKEKLSTEEYQRKIFDNRYRFLKSLIQTLQAGDIYGAIGDGLSTAYGGYIDPRRTFSEYQAFVAELENFPEEFLEAESLFESAKTDLVDYYNNMNWANMPAGFSDITYMDSHYFYLENITNPSNLYALNDAFNFMQQKLNNANGSETLVSVYLDLWSNHPPRDSTGKYLGREENQQISINYNDGLNEIYTNVGYYKQVRDFFEPLNAKIQSFVEARDNLSNLLESKKKQIEDFNNRDGYRDVPKIELNLEIPTFEENFFWSNYEASSTLDEIITESFLPDNQLTYYPPDEYYYFNPAPAFNGQVFTSTSFDLNRYKADMQAWMDRIRAVIPVIEEAQQIYQPSQGGYLQSNIPSIYGRVLDQTDYTITSQITSPNQTMVNDPFGSDFDAFKEAYLKNVVGRLWEQYDLLLKNMEGLSVEDDEDFRAFLKTLRYPAEIATSDLNVGQGVYIRGQMDEVTATKFFIESLLKADLALAKEKLEEKTFDRLETLLTVKTQVTLDALSLAGAIAGYKAIEENPEISITDLQEKTNAGSLASLGNIFSSISKDPLSELKFIFKDNEEILKLLGEAEEEKSVEGENLAASLSGSEAEAAKTYEADREDTEALLEFIKEFIKRAAELEERALRAVLEGATKIEVRPEEVSAFVPLFLTQEIARDLRRQGDRPVVSLLDNQTNLLDGLNRLFTETSFEDIFSASKVRQNPVSFLREALTENPLVTEFTTPETKAAFVDRAIEYFFSPENKAARSSLEGEEGATLQPTLSLASLSQSIQRSLLDAAAETSKEGFDVQRQQIVKDFADKAAAVGSVIALDFSERLADRVVTARQKKRLETSKVEQKEEKIEVEVERQETQREDQVLKLEDTSKQIDQAVETSEKVKAFPNEIFRNLLKKSLPQASLIYDGIQGVGNPVRKSGMTVPVSHFAV